MPRYRIEFDVRHCQGNFNCVSADPEHFEPLPGGKKSDVPGSSMEHGLKVLEIEADGVDAAVDAARVCPPQVIRVRDAETGEVLGGPEVLPLEKEEAAPGGERVERRV